MNHTKRFSAILMTLVLAMASLSLFAMSLTSCSASAEKIQVLILPKFEIGEMTGDDAGEAQFYYDEYCKGGEEYDIDLGSETGTLYVKDGVMLFVCGMTKVNSALNVDTLLKDSRFDFSDAYIIGTGCAGAATGRSVMGDVCLASAVVDYDIGHRVDKSELSDESGSSWFNDDTLGDSRYRELNSELVDKAYELTKDVKLETTDLTLKEMKAAYDNAKWASRNPRVLKGACVTADNYWKGVIGHEIAEEITQKYGAPDPYVSCEMEDLAITLACERNGLIDKVMILRDNVDMDTFMNGATPESLWGEANVKAISDEDNEEALDIFPVAMENNFKVGKVIIDAILNGKF